jgi:hypothetical protein
LKKWKPSEIQLRIVSRLKRKLKPKMQEYFIVVFQDTDTILAAIFNAIESLTREKSSDEEAL